MEDLADARSPQTIRLPDGRTFIVRVDPGEPGEPGIPVPLPLPAFLPPPTPISTLSRPHFVIPPVPPTPKPAEPTAPAILPIKPVDDDPIFDQPAVGGRFTVFSLFYGDHHAVHKRHVDTFLATAVPGRFEWRVASNALCTPSYAMLQSLQTQGIVSHWDKRAGNDLKYPVMRSLFRDPARPISTRWLIWLDDDTFFDQKTDWMARLARAIVDRPSPDVKMFGPRYIWTLQAGQGAWIKAASWYRGRPFRDARGIDSALGSRIYFASGSFWALETAAVLAADVPDARLTHNGGDYMIGEAIHQQGWDVGSFSDNKEVVNWSAVPRRGASLSHPGGHGG